MSGREVVITGMGLTSPLGATVSENWANVLALKTGIGHHPRPGVPRFMEYHGKSESPAIPRGIPEKLSGQVKFLNRGALLGFSAASEAIDQAGWTGTEVPADRRALYVAAGDFTKVGCESLYPAIREASLENWRGLDRVRLNAAALGGVNPFFLLESLQNNLFSFLSAHLESMGPNACLASLSPCGAQAIELAARSIRQSRADIAVAVGCGSWITEIALYELDGLGVASRCREGISSFRPLDGRRDGFITGEGGAALVLESAESAERSGATILGRIRGSGNCIEFVPGRPFVVPPLLGKRCMEIAMDDASRGFDDLAFIVPHGSGTRKGDAAELRSIASVLDERKAAVPVTALKAYTGHLGAASDIAEVILGIAAIGERLVPATLNFAEPDQSLPTLDIAGSHRQSTKKCFLSTSCGVGGQSSSVVVEAP